MGLTVLRPEWLLALAILPLLWFVWRRWPPPLARRRGVFALALRIALVTLLVLALAGVRLTTLPHQRGVIAVVDLSASTRHDLPAEAAAVRDLQAGKGPDDVFGVVTFAHGADVELPPTHNPNFDSFETQPDPTFTDIGGALRLAAGIIPDGYSRQLVLITDGRQNIGDAATTIAALRAEGTRVDVLPVGEAPGAEVMVLGVDAPSVLHEGESAAASVQIQSTGPAKGKLVIQVDGKDLQAADIDIPAGASTQSVDLPKLDPGLHRVKAEIDNASPDTYPDNNLAEAAIRVLGQPAVLVLEGRSGAGDNVIAALTAAGMKVDRRLASGAPVDTATLGRYDSAVVVDAGADQFPAGSLDALDAFVKDLGHGLVAIGGPNSYGPGGWQNTGLERALPVRMDLPPRKEKPRIAVAFVLESMENPAFDQLEISAVEGVIDKLDQNDQVAITTGGFNGARFAVPMTHVTDKKAIDAKLESQSAALGDPGSYAPYMVDSENALLATDAPLKHIVVVGDGDAQIPDQATLARIKSEGITVSSIGVRTHPPQQYMDAMNDIATYGGGKFYEADDASAVPDLILKESQVALRPWYEQDPFFPRVTSAGDLLSGVPLTAFPQLNGYVVTTAKPGADIYFMSPKDDPVLASWNYGLGRAVAWTPDSQGRWTSGFLQSDLSGKLFARMVAWTLPTSGDERLQSSAKLSGDSLLLTVNGPTDVSGATLDVSVLAPDLSTSQLTLPATAPGHWEGRLPAGAVGTYLIRVTLHRGGTKIAENEIDTVVPYSPEYLQLGRDDGRLKAFASVGGALLARPGQAWSEPALPIPTSSEIFWLLLALVALLWPIDIALRRLTMSAEQAREALVAILTLRRPAAIEVEAPAELVRLRQRIAPYRRRRGSPAVEVPPVVGTASAAGARPAADAARQTEEEKDAAGALSARLLEARRRRRGSGS